MKAVNDCEDLLIKYSEALLVAAYKQAKADNRWFWKKMVHEKSEKLFKQFVSTLVAKFLPRMPFVSGNSDGSDHIFNYSKNALFLGYLAKNFTDARKYADGERIIRLHKWLVLCFKTTNKSKYAFYTIQLLAQIKDLLPPALAHELMWNRSVNNRGFPSTNSELDRELEHRNKYAKKEFGSMEGKLTEKSIKRVSQCYQEVKDITDRFDSELKVGHGSGRHVKPDWKKDILELSKQFEEKQLFKFKGNRSHQKFPSFQHDMFEKIKEKEHKEWVTKLVMKFTRMNIYRNSEHIYTQD